MAETLAGVDYLGRCYDIFDLDPLDMAGSVKLPTAIQLPRDTQPVLDYEVPVGVNFSAPRRSSVLVTEGEVYNSSDFTSEISKALDMSIGFEGIGSFGASKSVRTVTSQTQSRKYVFKYVVAVVRNFVVALAEDGDHLAPSAEFSRAVAGLPTTAGAAYRAFIERFGTHFTTQISLGGMAFQSVRAETNTFRNSSETQEAFEARASLELGAFKPQSKYEEKQAEIRKADNEQSLSRSSITVVGATGGTSLPEEWFSKLERQPIPLPQGVRLKKLSELLTATLFPNDAAIDTKRRLLDEEVRRYSLERGCLVGEELRYGDKVRLQVRDERGRLLLRVNPKGIYLLPDSQMSKDAEATLIVRDPTNPNATGQVIFTAGNPNQSSPLALWIEELGTYLTMTEPDTKAVQYGVPTAQIGMSKDHQQPRTRWMGRSARGGLPRPSSSPKQPIVSGDDIALCQWDDRTRLFFKLGQAAREGNRLFLTGSSTDPLLTDPESDTWLSLRFCLAKAT